MLLDDTLAGYEALARAACAGLADRITSRAIGVHAPGNATSWLDISIVESESQGDPRSRSETIVTVTISVSVRDIDTSEGHRLARWIDGLAYSRLLYENTLRAALFAKIESGQVNLVPSDISGTIVLYLSRTIRAALQNFKIQQFEVLGLTTSTDGGASTVEGKPAGRAYDEYAGYMVSWVSPGIVLGPVAGTVMYAGASPGDDIEILDFSGTVIETIPVVTTPTGTVATSELTIPGDYNARIGGVTTARPLQITVKP